MNQHFEGTYHLQGDENQPNMKPARQQVARQPTASTLLSCSADFRPLKMEVIRSSETLVHIQTTRLYIPEDGNLPRHNLTAIETRCVITFC
jgi:hypothetical protein